MKLIVTPDKAFLEQIPHLPGVYRFFALDEDDNESVLYVGKAVDLFKRVKSYFQKTTQQSPRISLMIAQIKQIEITITENEASALILENNLIKSLKPKYNILFRDDKSYPLIRVSTHKFPRIDVYRGKTNQKLHQYFGPYPNSYAVSQAVNLIQKLFKLRTCADSVFANRSRPCMLYQIKLCTAPCVGYVNNDEYQSQVDQSLQFLQGNYAQIISDLTTQMNDKAHQMEFEAAASLRDRITMLTSISQNQVINNHNKPLTADIIFARHYLNRVYIYIISLQSGIYSGDKQFILNDPDNNLNQILEVFIQSHYLAHTHTKIIYLQTENNIKLDSEFQHMFYAATRIKILYTKSTILKKIAGMAEANLDRIIKNNQGDNELLTAATRLATLLGLEAIERVECVDISHTQGANAIASCVVYSNGRIDHSQYRRYNLSASVGGDDLSGMQLVLERRLKAVELPLPQVILIDGGIMQYRILKNIIQTSGLCDKIKPVSIFKGEKRNPQYDQAIIDEHKVVRYREDPVLFKLLQGLRDEAHRFAITGHRKAQIKTMAVSQLENIPNIGAVKRKRLLTHFGGIRGVMQASVDELLQVDGIGLSLAEQIYAYFHNE